MDPDEYLEWRQKLRTVWFQDDRFMALLEPVEQWALHQYFEFHSTKTDEEALGWLFTIRANQPTYEQDALLSFERLQLKLVRLQEAANQLPLNLAPINSGGIIVQTVVRPEPDLPKLSQMLARTVAEQSRREKPVRTTRRNPQSRA